MKKTETGFEGLYIIQHHVFNDGRGLFIKTYNKTIFSVLGLEVDIKERYFSISNKGVIRGMHFQTPPHDHVKLVNVMQGSILDAVVDIRAKSETYGKYFTITLKANEGKTLFIPKGFAHGFLALEDNTIVEYNQTSEYAPDNDGGIRYDSFGFNWGIRLPVISDRDKSFKEIENFITPF